MTDRHMKDVGPGLEKFIQEWKDHGHPSKGSMQINHEDGSTTILEMQGGLVVGHHLETVPLGDYRDQMPKRRALVVPDELKGEV